jgi:hypothetical protein
VEGIANLIPAFNKSDDVTEPKRKLTDAEVQAVGGRQRRRIRRALDRREARQQQRGQIRYNRQQRQLAFDEGTVRQQLRILRGELEVAPAMRANLEGHILRQHRLNEREQMAPERKANAEKRRSERLHDRRIRRADAGKSTHADLVALGMR